MTVNYIHKNAICYTSVPSHFCVGNMLGQNCNDIHLCMEGIQCASDGICRCHVGFYDDNKQAIGGTCRSSKDFFLAICLIYLIS